MGHAGAVPGGRVHCCYVDCWRSQPGQGRAFQKGASSTSEPLAAEPATFSEDVDTWCNFPVPQFPFQGDGSNSAFLRVTVESRWPDE